MATASKNRFIVDLGDLKLSEEDSRAIAHRIQSVVLDHLASTKLSSYPSSFNLIDDLKIRGMFVNPGGSKPAAE